MKIIIKKVKYLFLFIITYVLNLKAISAAKLNSGSMGETMYGVALLPSTSRWDSLTLWEKISIIIFSPVVMALFTLITLIIGIVVFLKRRRKNKGNHNTKDIIIFSSILSIFLSSLSYFILKNCEKALCYGFPLNYLANFGGSGTRSELHFYWRALLLDLIFWFLISFAILKIYFYLKSKRKQKI